MPAVRAPSRNRDACSSVRSSAVKSRDGGGGSRAAVGRAPCDSPAVRQSALVAPPFTAGRRGHRSRRPPGTPASDFDGRSRRWLRDDGADAEIRADANETPICTRPTAVSSRERRLSPTDRRPYKTAPDRRYRQLCAVAIS